MTQIEVIIDGKREAVTLDEFFERYRGLLKYEITKIIEEEISRNGKIRNLLRK